ncbi:MAG: hypothetical protein R3A79_03890 [Nannocystaceae bacterium]
MSDTSTAPVSPSGTFKTLLQVPEWIKPTAHLGSRRGLWWRRSRERFVWADLDAGASETIDFPDLPADGDVSMYADRRRLLRKHGTSFELWHCERGLVARRAVPPAPPSVEPLLRGRPQQELHWLSGDDRHLWYMGYDDHGAPLLYLFDASTLQLRDSVGPPMSIGRVASHVPAPRDWCGAPQRFTTYPGGEPVGLFSPSCDELGYLMWLAVRPEGTIDDRATPGLRRAAAATSDTVATYLRAPQADRILAFTDLHEVHRVDLKTEAIDRSASFLAPFESERDPDLLEVAPYRGSVRSTDLWLTEVVATAAHIYLDLSLSPHVSEDDANALGDFPWRFFVMLDAATLQPVGFVDPYALGGDAEEVQAVDLLEDGTIAVQLAGAERSHATRIVEWTAASA